MHQIQCNICTLHEVFDRLCNCQQRTMQLYRRYINLALCYFTTDWSASSVRVVMLMKQKRRTSSLGTREENAFRCIDKERSPRSQRSLRSFVALEYLTHLWTFPFYWIKCFLYLAREYRKWRKHFSQKTNHLSDPMTSAYSLLLSFLHTIIILRVWRGNFYNRAVKKLFSRIFALWWDFIKWERITFHLKTFW